MTLLYILVLSITNLAVPKVVNDELMSIVSGIMNQSALLEPSQEKYRISAAVETLYTNRIKKSHLKSYFRPEMLRMRNCPRSRGNTPASRFQREFNDDLEQSMPQWNISVTELDVVFDKVRFERYLYYENNMDFKRRISWLYPPDGMYT